MTIFKQHDIRGLVGTLCGACIVTLVALGFSAAPAWAQQNFNPLPPQVAFISNGKYTGTLRIQGVNAPPLQFTGSIAYLTGDIEYEHISVDPTAAQLPTGVPLITSDTWLVETATAINEWEIVSTFPNICRTEVLSPQCNAWSRTPRGIYVQTCTVTEQGKQTTLEKAVQLSTDNKLVQYSETATIDLNLGALGLVPLVESGITITMTSQGTTPPVPSDFNRPSICPAAANDTDNNQVEELVEELGCTGTIPNICF
jgi:hypothetical protein